MLYTIKEYKSDREFYWFETVYTQVWENFTYKSKKWLSKPICEVKERANVSYFGKGARSCTPYSH